ncbi:YqeG family HAD IIIA-type phosphatase [bacterium 3DAC]|nr:YqeG family HAD IIIA-type phosphatase [bacterium 3DAC]
MKRIGMVIDKLSDISPDLLYEKGIRFVVLDLDNTLSPYGDFNVELEVKEWIVKAKKMNMDIVVLSNTWFLRALISRFIVNVPVYYMALKPSPLALWKVLIRYGYSPDETCVIGDQIFTDVLMARLAGTSFVLVKPLSRRDGPHTKLFRILERSFIAKKILSSVK